MEKSPGHNPWWDKRAIGISQMSPEGHRELDYVTKDLDLLDAAQGTYTGNDSRGIANLYANDIGLEPYYLPITQNKSPMVGGKSVGGFYDPNTKRLVSTPISEELNLTTMLHELTHAAEDTKGVGMGSRYQDYQERPGLPQFMNTSNHFGMTPDFEGDMGYSMASQHMLERGLPVHPNTLKEMPWLKSVRPLSSNPVANPWKDLPDELPPSLWNDIYHGH